MDRWLAGLKGTLSLSARRAWIEIQCNTVIDGQSAVSLSARRAWIEIEDDIGFYNIPPVALRKESVDRNWYCAARGFGY